MRLSKKTELLAGLGVLAIALCSAYFVFLKSDLSWTFKQPAYRRGILELLIVFAVLVLSLKLSKSRLSRQLFSVVLIAGVFLFLHSYFFAALIGILYIGELVLLGRMINELILPTELKGESFGWFISGVSLQIVVVALCSILEIGTAERLRLVFAALCPIAFLVNRRTLHRMTRELTERPGISNSMEIICVAGIVTLFLLQMGRANICLDYDSVWYGLRSDYMLAPYTGIFDNVISVETVYNYSKGYEVFTLPFSGLSSFGITYFGNLFFGICIIAAAYKCSSLFCNRVLGLLAGLAVAATPGIMNMAVTAKGDLGTVALEMFGVFFCLKAIHLKTNSFYLLALMALILSFVFKPTSLYFSSVIIAVGFVFFMIQREKNNVYGKKALILPLCALVFIYGRTFRSSGMLDTHLFPKLFRTLGLIRYPYEFGISTGTSSPLNDPAVLIRRIVRLFEYFVAPITKSSGHIIIAWSGLLFFISLLCFVILAITWCVRYAKTDGWSSAWGFELVIFLVISIISGGELILSASPDGNYHAIWYAITYVFTLCFFSRISFKPERVSFWGRFVVCVLVGFNSAVCLASNTSWTLGLTGIDASRLGYYNSQEKIDDYFRQEKIDLIKKKLEETGKIRVMMFSDDYQYKLLLPAIIDSWHGTDIWGKNSTKDSTSFISYLDKIGVQALLLDREYILRNPHARRIVEDLTQAGVLQIELVQENHALVKYSTGSKKKDERILSFLDGEYWDLPEGYRVLYDMNENPYVHTVSPKTKVDTPTGTGVFFYQDNLTVLSRYLDTVYTSENLDFSGIEAIIISAYMPYEISDGAKVKVFLNEDETELMICEFEISPENPVNDIFYLVDDTIDTVSSVNVAVYSPSGDDTADWVVFDELILLQSDK